MTVLKNDMISALDMRTNDTMFTMKNWCNKLVEEKLRKSEANTNAQIKNKCNEVLNFFDVEDLIGK